MRRVPALGIAVATLLLMAFATNAEEGSVLRHGTVSQDKGEAKAVIALTQPGILMARAYVLGGVPTGETMLDRSGVEVQILIDGRSCAKDRDVRRNVDPKKFKGDFQVTTGCMDYLSAGDHQLVAKRTNINSVDARLELTWTVLKIQGN